MSFPPFNLVYSYISKIHAKRKLPKKSIFSAVFTESPFAIGKFCRHFLPMESFSLQTRGCFTHHTACHQQQQKQPLGA